MRLFVQVGLLLVVAAVGGCVATVDLTTLVTRNGRAVNAEGAPYSGKVVEYHDGKRLAVSGAFVNGRRHGMWKRWDEKDRPLSEGAYRDGRRHGPWTFWHDGGKRVERGSFVNGLKHGTWSFHVDGKLTAKAEYADGRNIGQWRLAVVPRRTGQPKPVATPKPGAAAPTPKVTDRVSVRMYVMSKCPFGVQAEQGMHEALADLGAHVDYQLNYIVNERDGKFSALHGDAEVLGNIQQLCARDIYPEQRRWTEFVNCQNADWRNIPDTWEGCARLAGMDVEKLRPCVTGSRGLDLLRESMNRSKRADAQGSPTIVIAGNSYQGGRSKVDFMRAICDAIDKDKPKPCLDIPEDIEVRATLLTDKRCAKCSTDGLIANLRGRFFSKLTVRTVDYGTPEGKELYRDIGQKRLPVVLFDPEVKKAFKYDSISRWMAPHGKYMKLRVPSYFDPTAEICDNNKDDTGNGQVDCRDPGCKDAMICRKEERRHLQVFIMSQCPFAVKGLTAMKEVVAAFGPRLKFDVHFIANKKPGGGFTALHGQSEVDENIRMLCVKKLYPRKRKWLDYVWCRYAESDWRSDKWQKCAKRGIRAAAIKRCVKKRGEALLAHDIKIAEALDISGSPTWLANNKFKFSGIDAERIAENICKHNPKMRGCKKKLSGQSGGAGGACGK